MTTDTAAVEALAKALRFFGMFCGPSDYETVDRVLADLRDGGFYLVKLGDGYTLQPIEAQKANPVCSSYQVSLTDRANVVDKRLNSHREDLDALEKRLSALELPAKLNTHIDMDAYRRGAEALAAVLTRPHMSNVSDEDFARKIAADKPESAASGYTNDELDERVRSRYLERQKDPLWLSYFNQLPAPHGGYSDAEIDQMYTDWKRNKSNA